MNIICLGELIVDFTSREPGKPLSRVSLFEKHVGGAPANVAIGLHFHNIPVRLWSKVGADSLGKFLVEQLTEMGLNMDGILWDRTHPTKIALVGVDENGERTFEFHNRDSAERYIRPGDLNAAELRTAHIFHFGGVALLGEVTADTVFRLLKQAKDARCLVSFDPNIRLNLCGEPDRLMKKIEQALPLVDILKMSKSEYRMFFPDTPPQQIIAKGISLLIITDGANGSRFVTQTADLDFPAPSTRVVDTTGAGDAFISAILARLFHMGTKDLSRLTRQQIEQMANFATQWAGKIIAHPGAVSGYFINSKNI